MALQCLAVLRTVAARAHHYVKHAAHHLGRHHVHRAGHWIAHPIVAPTAVRVTVCTLAGLAAIGIGGVSVTGTSSHSLVPGKLGSPATLPPSSAPSAIGGSASAPITFAPSTIGGLSDLSPFAPSDGDGSVDPSFLSEPGIGGLTDTPPSDPSPFAPSEGNASVDPSFLLDPRAAGLTDAPPSDPREPGVSADASGRPAGSRNRRAL
jgi:hypothetical protein